MAMHMSDVDQTKALLRALSWFTPALPTGAFAYSSGLEAAFAEGILDGEDEVCCWIRAGLVEGAAWNDAVLCAAAWRGDEPAEALSDFAAALAPGAERCAETLDLGDAFAKAVSAWLPALRDRLGPRPTLPVAAGCAAREGGLPLKSTLLALLHAYASNQVQAALRLGRLGQDSGLRILAVLEADIEWKAAHAERSTLDDLGAATLNADLLSLHHEQLETRIFRS